MNNLKRLRSIKKMSQQDLSFRSGVALRNIQDYEQGITKLENVRYKTLYKLSMALECKVEDIINL